MPWSWGRFLCQPLRVCCAIWCCSRNWKSPLLGNLLGSLIQSCPKLRHLELTCGHKPSFQLVSIIQFQFFFLLFWPKVVIQDTFAKTIRDFPKLRSLNLTIVRYPGDETLTSGAAHIARSNPRLRNFKLTFIPCPASLCHSIPSNASHLCLSLQVHRSVRTHMWRTRSSFLTAWCRTVLLPMAMESKHVDAH